MYRSLLGLYHSCSRNNSKTLRAESQRRAVMRSWSASSTVLGKSLLGLIPFSFFFFSITALVASLLKMTEIAFFAAIFLFTSSFLSIASLFLSKRTMLSFFFWALSSLTAL
uniref:Uncharacterized protein n=1 Tax=Opuntia streptacantha TaxID=393608 RepID=A0A7C9CNL6_OPUST